MSNTVYIISILVFCHRPRQFLVFTLDGIGLQII